MAAYTQAGSAASLKCVIFERFSYSEVPRILLPRTWVNKAKKRKGRSPEREDARGFPGWHHGGAHPGGRGGQRRPEAARRLARASSKTFSDGDRASSRRGVPREPKDPLPLGPPTRPVPRPPRWPPWR